MSGLAFFIFHILGELSVKPALQQLLKARKKQARCLCRLHQAVLQTSLASLHFFLRLSGITAVSSQSREFMHFCYIREQFLLRSSIDFELSQQPEIITSPLGF